MNVTVLKRETYLAMIRNSVGSNLFRNLYALVDGEQKDILSDGEISCAFFVSSILHQFGFIKTPHATVLGLEKDLQSSGWNKVERPSPGDVIVWEPWQQANGEIHPHVGFCITDIEAISNSDRTRTPVQHELAFGTKPDGSPTRAITALYRLDN